MEDYMLEIMLTHLPLKEVEKLAADHMCMRGDEEPPTKREVPDTIPCPVSPPIRSRAIIVI